MDLFCFAAVNVCVEDTRVSGILHSNVRCVSDFAVAASPFLDLTRSPWVACMLETVKIPRNLVSLANSDTYSSNPRISYVGLHGNVEPKHRLADPTRPLAHCPLPDNISESWGYLLSVFSASHLDYCYALHTCRTIFFTTQFCSGLQCPHFELSTAPLPPASASHYGTVLPSMSPCNRPTWFWLLALHSRGHLSWHPGSGMLY